MSEINDVLERLKSGEEITDNEIERLVLSMRGDVVSFIKKIIEEEGTVQEGEMTKTQRSSLWNEIAMQYFFHDKDEESKKILGKVVDMESNNPGTLNNFSLVLLSTDHPREAKKYILKAFDLDVRHRKSEAVLLPAYRNLSWILINEAEEYNRNNDYFPAFLLSWISIELSLRRLWAEFCQKKSYNGKWLSRLGIRYRIEVLSFLGIIDSVENDVRTTWGRRNDIMHATGETPTRGETTRCIETASKLASMG